MLEKEISFHSNKNSLEFTGSQSSIASFSKTLKDPSVFQNLPDELIIMEDVSKNKEINDLEMMYLFLHQKKDMDIRKNKMENTIEEYSRDLLIMYKQIIENAFSIGLDLNAQQNPYQIFKLLNHVHIRKFQEWLAAAPLGKGKKPYAVSTLSRKMVVLKGFLSFLYKTKYIEVPLHEKMLSSNVRDIDRPDRDLGKNEVVQILDYYKDHPIVHCLLATLITTGLRINELCHSKISDISYVDGDYWLYVLGKGRHEREVLLHPYIIEEIRKFRRTRRLDFILDGSDNSYIFMTNKGKPYNYKYLSNYLTKKINEADLPFIKTRKNPITPHTLRHAFAQISSDQGASLDQIKIALGHKSIQTTSIYLQKKSRRENNAGHAWKNSSIMRSL